MDLWTFWQSVPSLRRVEFITLVATMVFPVLSGTVLLTLRYRIKTLLDHALANQAAFAQDSLERLDSRNRAQARALSDLHTQYSR